MSIVFDRAVSYYDQTRGLPQALEAWLVAAVREHTHLQSGSRVLEVGIGTGRVAVPLVRANGYHYVGVDLSRSMMDVLRAKASGLPITLAQADAARLPFPDHSFDAVVAVHIFHLIGEWDAALNEVRRVLKPGGVLLHGRNQHDEGQLEALHRMLSEVSRVDQTRRDRGLLDKPSEYLPQRFGMPREYTAPQLEVTQTPREVLDYFRDRMWSGLWNTPDDVLAQAVAQGQQLAEEQFGDLDAPIPQQHSFMWQIFTPA